MTSQTAKQISNDRLNGIDTQAMTQIVGALQRDRSLAKFEFRASNKWLGGSVNRSTIQGFFGAGGEDKSRSTPFTYTNDEPPLLLGNNAGANPGEFLLHALAGCVTTTTVLHAVARGIAIESISTELRGDIDLQGLLDLDKSVRPGYEKITLNMDIKADCSDAELDDLLTFVHGHSPVCDTICRPVPVVIERVRRS
jgi:uncharacterized OsmC-like protein